MFCQALGVASSHRCSPPLATTGTTASGTGSGASSCGSGRQMIAKDGAPQIAALPRLSSTAPRRMSAHSQIFRNCLVAALAVPQGEHTFRLGIVCRNQLLQFIHQFCPCQFCQKHGTSASRGFADSWSNKSSAKSGLFSIPCPIQRMLEWLVFNVATLQTNQKVPPPQQKTKTSKH